MHTSSLFHIATARPDAQLRLVCFSYAGGNANHFLGWQADLHPEVELVICQLPGRGVRLFETPYDDMDTLVRDLASASAELLDKPLVFFGHSLGAKLAYELGLALQKRALPAPLHTVISAATAPFHQRPGPPIHQLPEAEFVAAVARLGGTPAQILRNRELMALCTPALRADYKLVETYRNRSKQQIAGQLTLLGGLDDPFVSPEQLSAWCPLYQSVIEAYWFDGGHFFINQHSEQVLQFLNESVLEFNLRRLQQRSRPETLQFPASNCG
ncbi:thioesterase [Pseudomaricurvus alcaniphilus]|uniref:thioesterase II family protein n=1 Tax=Pseudomaricurvus alcaniphilus TaxID=1166482 RepID=UPI00140AF6D3|nr:alpha/beta fold hydrolase [Pseudomaricurvus alcaniphilus]NHN38208.1 thioesterase [Pseudomaricurvus alcaniphilus]